MTNDDPEADNNKTLGQLYIERDAATRKDIKERVAYLDGRIHERERLMPIESNNETLRKIERKADASLSGEGKGYIFTKEEYARLKGILRLQHNHTELLKDIAYLLRESDDTIFGTAGDARSGDHYPIAVEVLERIEEVLDIESKDQGNKNTDD